MKSEKIKENKGTIIFTSILVLLPMIVGLILWDKLPEELATHFDMNDQPDGYSSKAFAVFGLPLILLATHLLCTFITATDPKQQGIGNKVFKLILFICPVVSLVIIVLVYGYALNLPINVGLFGMIFLGCLFMIIGNYLPKSRQNYTVGIRIPWTLEDEDNWNKTHRMAGGLWMVGGFLILLNAFIRFVPMWTSFIILALMVVIPVIYSFALHVTKKDQSGEL